MDGVDFKTTDLLKWGAGSGAGAGGNLTPTQADLNFWTLLTRTRALELSPPVAVQISGITIVGTQMQFNMSDGSHFGPFTLPIATFQLKGDWVNAMHYYQLDIISVPHRGLYLTRIEHTSAVLPAVFDPDLLIGGFPAFLQLFGEDVWIYDFGFFFPGRPGLGVDDGANIAGHILVRPVIMPATLPGSKAKLLTATTAALSFPIKKNGTPVGSVDFAIGATSGTFTFAADVALATNDVVQLGKPTAVDVGARELTVTFAAVREF